MSEDPILSEGRSVGALPLEPLVCAVTLELDRPSLSDNRGDRERLLDALDRALPGRWRLPLAVLRRLGGLLRAQDWRAVALVHRDSGLVLDVRPPGPQRVWGLAVDLGTTTVAAQLVDLADGKVLGRASSLNEQIARGDDLLTRIAWADREGGLADLSRRAARSIGNLAKRLATTAGGEPADICAAVVAGNTVMTQLLLGLDPAAVSREPYLPAANAPEPVAAADLELGLFPRAPVWCLPNVGSFVGGDVLAGVLSSGMHRETAVSLFVDVGTNGELVLGGADWLVAAAGAAGPAFEGGVVKHGMRAAPGAVEHLTIDPATRRVSYRTLGGEPARGLCGSGLIDAVAELFLSGVVDRTGRFREGEEFVLVSADQTADGRAITLDETDLRNFLRTKAGMHAAVELALARVGLAAADLAHVYLAGAIANYVDVAQAVNIGLLPDLPPERFVSLGNASLEGARLALVSRQARRELEDIRSRVSYLELNAEPGFMELFSAALFLPHTDEGRFPSVLERLAARRGAS